MNDLKNFLDKKLIKTYVINVQHSIYRYNHVLYEFSKYDIKNYTIVKAITPEDKEVKEFYSLGKVMAYPPCFRCKYIKCNHKNNFITPLQVANFLSFKNIMLKISKENVGLYLILEDDFYFKPITNAAIKRVENFLVNKDLFNTNQPLLFRVGSHTISRKKINYLNRFLNYFKISKNIFNMSNPGFIINQEFAKLFISDFKFIDTTSDFYIHNELCDNNKVLNYSIEPFPIGQNSYGRKINLFDSEIVNENSSKNLINLSSKEEYDKFLSGLLI